MTTPTPQPPGGFRVYDMDTYPMQSLTSGDLSKVTEHDFFFLDNLHTWPATNEAILKRISLDPYTYFTPQLSAADRQDQFITGTVSYKARMKRCQELLDWLGWTNGGSRWQLTLATLPRNEQFMRLWHIVYGRDGSGRPLPIREPELLPAYYDARRYLINGAGTKRAWVATGAPMKDYTHKDPSHECRLIDETRQGSHPSEVWVKGGWWAKACALDEQGRSTKQLIHHKVAFCRSCGLLGSAGFEFGPNQFCRVRNALCYQCIQGSRAAHPKETRQRTPAGLCLNCMKGRHDKSECPYPKEFSSRDTWRMATLEELRAVTQEAKVFEARRVAVENPPARGDYQAMRPTYGDSRSAGVKRSASDTNPMPKKRPRKDSRSPPARRRSRKEELPSPPPASPGPVSVSSIETPTPTGCVKLPDVSLSLDQRDDYIQQLKKQNDSMATELKKKISDLTHENGTLKIENDNLKVSKESIQKKLESCEKSKREYKDENVDLKSKISFLNGKIAAYESSRRVSVKREHSSSDEESEESSDEKKARKPSKKRARK